MTSTPLVVEIDTTAPRVNRPTARPNPLNLSRARLTRIGYRVGEAADVRAAIVKAGRVVKGLPDETTSAASNVLHIWNATNNDNRTVVPGVYRFRTRVSDLAGNGSLARGSIRVVR